MSNHLTAKELERRYETYIDTLNLEDWDEGVYTGLARHIEPTVNHNGKILDYAGYARLIPPMAHFVIADLLVDARKRQIAARLNISIEEKRLTEHVFYHYCENGKIDRVWSLVQEGQVTGQMDDPRLSSTRPTRQACTYSLPSVIPRFHLKVQPTELQRVVPSAILESTQVKFNKSPRSEK